MVPLNKRALVDLIIAHLTAELDRYAKAARSAQAEATDPQSRAENKYDTRGLEASYLSHGQSRQALETGQARQQFVDLPLRDFAAGEPIELGALVELERGRKERMHYFLGPSGGGVEVQLDGLEILVITPPSPLGQQLIGQRSGAQITAGGGLARIVSVR